MSLYRAIVTKRSRPIHDTIYSNMSQARSGHHDNDPKAYLPERTRIESYILATHILFHNTNHKMLFFSPYIFFYANLFGLRSSIRFLFRCCITVCLAFLYLFFIESKPVNGQIYGGSNSLNTLSTVTIETEIANLVDKIETDTSRVTHLKVQIPQISQQRHELLKQLHIRFFSLYRITRIGILPSEGGVDALVQRIAKVKHLKRLVSENLLELQRFDDQQKAYRQELVKLSKRIVDNRSRLQQLQNLVSKEQPKDEPFSNAFQTSTSSLENYANHHASKHQDFYGIRLVDEEPIHSFKSLKGNLALPITGDFVLHDSRGENNTGSGLGIQTTIGTVVRAVAAGKVGFSNHHSKYGKLVILDHGDAYFTVYGGLGSIEVKVGDVLSRNARLGTVGSHFSPPKLFFEVRRGTRSLPPRQWLGL